MNGVISHIEINVSDLKKSTLFWEWLLTDKFDYTKFQDWDSGISFKLADTYIVIVQTDKEFIDAKYHRKNTGLNHIAFHCNSKQFVDELTNELHQKNIKILYRNKHPFAGGQNHYAVFFEDPDKIKVEVVAKIDN